MPYASDAQRRFFHTATAKAHGITTAQVADFDKASKGLKLPERTDEKEGPADKPDEKEPKLTPPPRKFSYKPKK